MASGRLPHVLDPTAHALAARIRTAIHSCLGFGRRGRCDYVHADASTRHHDIRYDWGCCYPGVENHPASAAMHTKARRRTDTGCPRTGTCNLRAIIRHSIGLGPPISVEEGFPPALPSEPSTRLPFVCTGQAVTSKFSLHDLCYRGKLCIQLLSATRGRGMPRPRPNVFAIMT